MRNFFKMNIGHVLTIITIIGGLLVTWRDIELKAATTEKDIEYIKREQITQNAIINDTVTKLEATSITLAKITERLEWLQKSSVRTTPPQPNPEE